MNDSRWLGHPAVMEPPAADSKVSSDDAAVAVKQVQVLQNLAVGK